MMKRKVKVWTRVGLAILLALIIGNLFFGLGLPSYHIDRKTNDLIFRNVRLVPMPFGQSVDTPNSFSLWSRIGHISGGNDLYKFNDNGQVYVATYNSDLEGFQVYKYAIT